jgi:pilus assembly protein CpaB
MKVRGVLVVAAFLVAAGATAAIFAYVNGVKNDHAATATNTVSVIVAKQDIPAGTNLDELVSSGAFTTLQVPQDAVVPGAVTSLSQLSGQVTSLPIVSNEQIPAGRLVGTAQLGGGILGIPKGFEAVTIPLDASKSAGAVLQRGDHVTVYATFNSAPGGLAATVSLVPDTQVLQFDTTTNDVTLALKPYDGQRVIFAQNQGIVWLALLPPNQAGTKRPPVTLEQAAK